MIYLWFVYEYFVIFCFFFGNLFLRKFNGVSSFFMIFLGFALLFIRISKKNRKIIK